MFRTVVINEPKPASIPILSIRHSIACAVFVQGRLGSGVMTDLEPTIIVERSSKTGSCQLLELYSEMEIYMVAIVYIIMLML